MYGRHPVPPSQRREWVTKYRIVVGIVVSQAMKKWIQVASRGEISAKTSLIILVSGRRTPPSSSPLAKSTEESKRRRRGREKSVGNEQPPTSNLSAVVLQHQVSPFHEKAWLTTHTVGNAQYHHRHRPPHRPPPPPTASLRSIGPACRYRCRHPTHRPDSSKAPLERVIIEGA